MKKNQINEDEVFLINPDYFVKVETFGSNNDKVVVVDDFYAYPAPETTYNFYITQRF